MFAAYFASALGGDDRYGRVVAMVEAVLGQLCLITAVAVVVQSLGLERKAGREAD